MHWAPPCRRQCRTRSTLTYFSFVWFWIMRMFLDMHCDFWSRVSSSTSTTYLVNKSECEPGKSRGCDVPMSPYARNTRYYGTVQELTGSLTYLREIRLETITAKTTGHRYLSPFMRLKFDFISIQFGITNVGNMWRWHSTLFCFYISVAMIYSNILYILWHISLSWLYIFLCYLIYDITSHYVTYNITSRWRQRCLTSSD